MKIDTITYQLFQQIENPALTAFAKIIAILTDPITLTIIALILTTYLYLNKKKNQATLLATATIFTGIAIKIIKEIFQQPRPISILIQETGYSFPSGHAMMSVVFLGLIVYIFTNKQNKTKLTLTSIILILIIIFSRLYLQAHWLTDIIGGIIIGSIILSIAIIIYKKLLLLKSNIH